MARDTKTYTVMSKEEERKALQALSAKIRKDPKVGIEIAQSAGILNKDGHLTSFYKQKA